MIRIFIPISTECSFGSIHSFFQASVAAKRLTTFFLRSELNACSVSREPTPGVAAVIERGVFAWDPEDEPVLHNVSMHFPEGQMTAIVGRVGSGKSSLLQALLGDMEQFAGRVNVTVS
ncbi:unnamed protein product [Protopolystoma xenopodis]|uniref:ABC transporter domain-containing protein n=1 Tax=Protopolystoma xenopodis TaxID=117903 RepID=A0A448WBB9_9PLAT|nr:unnamed protein product [Protopolystoma xenopodis]